MKLLIENWNNYLIEQQFRDEVIVHLAKNNVVLTEQQLNEVNWRELARKFATPAALFVAMSATGPAQANDVGLDMFGSMLDNAYEQSVEAAPQADVETSQNFGNQLAVLALANTPEAPETGTQIAIQGNLGASATQQGLDQTTFKDTFHSAFTKGLQQKGYKVVEIVPGDMQNMSSTGVPSLKLQLQHSTSSNNWEISYQGPGIDEDLAYRVWTPRTVQK